MIRDLESVTPDGTEVSDVCVIGAGAAGIALAVALSMKGKTVTLLEGGGAEIEEASQEPYRSEVVGSRHKGVNEGRFRAKGGTTTRWGGQILEYDAWDFAVRDWVPGSGWPFGKEELTKYYSQAFELEGFGPSEIREDEKVWGRLKMGSPMFEGLEAYFTRWCPVPNFAVLHGQTLKHNPRISMWLHANAVGMELRDERVDGVRCRTLGGEEATFRAKEYVFCLGTIESARFFLQPREGGLPWNESGLLGKHFQDHIDSNAAEVRPVHAARFHERFDNVFLDGNKYHPKLRLTRAKQEELKTLNVGATMLFVSEMDETLAGLKATAKRLMRGRVGEVTAGDVWGLAGNLPLLIRQGYRYGVEHRAYNPADARIMLRVHCEQEPLGESSVTLAEERDSLGLLRTRLDWRISERELATIRSYVDVAAEALKGVAEVVPDADLMAGSGAYRAMCDDSNHHMGGMRMGATAGTGVVDGDLRLWGTKNAYVLSGAVFPTSGYSNPTHTLLALAVRLAEHLS